MENNANEFETKHEVHTGHNENGSHESPRKAVGKMSKKTGIAIVVLVIIIIVGGLAWLYTGTLSSAKEKVLRVLPLPAAIVDMKLVSAKEAMARIALANQLAESQGMGIADRTLIYDQMLDAKKLAAVAGNHRISVSKAEIDEEYTNIVKQYANGDEDQFKTELDKAYHMTPEKFKNEVIKQELLQAKLALWYSEQQDLNEASYATAKDLQSKIDGGQSIEEVAKNYAQDETIQDFAGDSGIIAFDDLLPEFRVALKDNKPGDIKLVASRYGLHILKMLEQNNDGPDGARQVHLQQVFIKQVGFAEWLKEQTDNIRVVKLINFS